MFPQVVSIVRTVLFLGLFFFLGTALAAVSSLHTESLVVFYESTGGENWSKNDNWLTGDPCDDVWHGVVCSDENTEITELRLAGNRLRGPLPSELGNIDSLLKLTIQSNKLTGSIPKSLQNLSLLKLLNLSKNRLSGTIPTELGKLANLVELNLSFNILENSIPASLFNQASLKRLDLSRSRLSGNIPSVSGDLSQLVFLDLSFNDLKGPIPFEFCKFLNLIDLDLSFNELTGSISPEVGCLLKLKSLDLSVNNLTGPIPIELGDLTQLVELYLGSNNLASQIPSALGGMIGLQVLSLYGNDLEGTIPSELGDIAGLQELVLSGNHLTGNIPSSFGKLFDLVHLNLSYNNLHGAAPDTLRNMTSLFLPYLDYNGLWAATPALDRFLDNRCFCNWSAYQTVSPTGIQVSHSGPESVALTWDPIEFVPPHEFAFPSGRYIVSIGTTVGGPYMLAGSTQSKSDVDFQADDLVPGTYYFVIQSQTDKNMFTSDYSEEVMVLIDRQEGETIVTWPKNIQATDGTYADRVEVTWHALGGVHKFRVYRCADLGPTCGDAIGDTKETIFNDTEATPGVEYFYRVRACTMTRCGRFSAARKGKMDIIPAAPDAVMATDGMFTGNVRLSWNPVEGAREYRVFRCENNDLACGSPIAYRVSTVFNDTRGIPEQVYYYRVRACTLQRCGDFSLADSGYAVKPVDKPTDVTASDGAFEDRVSISWTGVMDATVYRVFRCLNRYAYSSCNAPIGFSQNTSFEDTRGQSGTLYYYRIKACTNYHCSWFSVDDVGHRESTPTVEGEASLAARAYTDEVPIPTLGNVAQRLLILLMIGTGVLYTTSKRII